MNDDGDRKPEDQAAAPAEKAPSDGGTEGHPAPMSEEELEQILT